LQTLLVNSTLYNLPVSKFSKKHNGNQETMKPDVNPALIAINPPVSVGKIPGFKSAPGTPRTAPGRGGECVLKFFSGFM